MKTFTPVLVLLFISLSTFAQTQKITIYCRLSENGKADYGSLKGIMPLILTEGARDSLFIDPRRQYHLSNFVDALLLMTLNGWKPASTEQSLGRVDGNVYTYHLLTKDIYLDEKSKAMLIERLKTAGN